MTATPAATGLPLAHTPAGRRHDGRQGFTGSRAACEPTGPRWMQVQRLCAERGLPLVCIQPLISHIAREQQDYTMHKTDESDCVMIARLTEPRRSHSAPKSDSRPGPERPALTVTGSCVLWARSRPGGGGQDRAAPNDIPVSGGGRSAE
jgi:hypothetical protein